MKFLATLFTITCSYLGFSQGLESKTKKENLIVSYAGLTISGELNDSIIKKHHVSKSLTTQLETIKYFHTNLAHAAPV